MEINATDYVSRAALDEYVSKLSDTQKATATIVGSTVDLARLHLSSRIRVFGVPCVPDDLEAKPVTDKPARGKEQPFGLNGNLKKKPKPKRT